jgi:hypothetical protein
VRYRVVLLIALTLGACVAGYFARGHDTLVGMLALAYFGALAGLALTVK